MLYAIVDITNQKYSGKIAPTSKACEWIKPRARNLSPKKSQEMVFRKDKSATTAKIYNITTSNHHNLLSSEIVSFKEKLEKVNPNAAWLKNFETNNNNLPGPEFTLPELHNISFQYKDSVDISSVECLDIFSTYFDNLSLTKEQCVTINELTLGQHENHLWKSARFGRLTASNFGNIVRRQETTPPENLVKYLLGYTSSFSNYAVEWGNSHEQIAVHSYLSKVRESHPSLTFKNNGLIVNEKYPHLGASPDGIICCFHCEPNEGLIEIKCPYRLRDLHPMEAAKNENFFCEIIDGKFKLRRNHAYFYQVQGQLAISNCEWCHFIVWTNKGMEYETIVYDKNLWENVMLPKLNAFYCYAIIPELFTDRVKRGLKLY